MESASVSYAVHDLAWFVSAVDRFKSRREMNELNEAFVHGAPRWGLRLRPPAPGLTEPVGEAGQGAGYIEELSAAQTPCPGENRPRSCLREGPAAAVRPGRRPVERTSPELPK